MNQAKPGNQTTAPANMNRAFLRFCIVAIACAPIAASAHVGVGDTHGFAHGFAHPFTGLDHVLAITAVGLFAAHLGGRSLWLLPLTFVSVMAIACAGSLGGGDSSFVEIGIGLSVVAFGLAVALQPNVPTLVALVVVGFFAIFHGHAHGMEMPANVSGMAYGLGLVCATVLLHTIGLGSGIAIDKLGHVYSRRIARVGGTAIAISGLVMVALP